MYKSINMKEFRSELIHSTCVDHSNGFPNEQSYLVNVIHNVTTYLHTHIYKVWRSVVDLRVYICHLPLIT